MSSLVLGNLSAVPAGASPAAAPVTAGVTLLVIVVIALCGADSSMWLSGGVRCWAVFD